MSLKPKQTGQANRQKPKQRNPQRDRSDVLRAHAKLEQKPHPEKRTKKPLLPAETLLHELQVNQAELEMQNEKLRRTQISLEESRDHYIDFYDFAPVGYITLNDKGLISEINLTGASLLGVERNKLLKQRFARFIVPEENDHYYRFFTEVLTSDEKQTSEMVFKRGDGSKFDAQLDCIRMLKAGDLPQVRVVLTDITARKQVDEVVREQEEFFRMIAENTEDFIAVLDLEGRRIYNNPSYARLFGDIERLKGTDSFAEIHPEDRGHVKQIFSQTVRSGVGLHADFRFVLPNGSIRHMESRGGLIRNFRGRPMRVVVVSRDITARKLAEEEIRQLAFHDELTKLPNRRLLNDRLVQYMAASKRSGQYGAMMFMDLDNFKPLNDEYGHSVGDLLLVEVTHRLEKCVREADTVARFGGDEFVVLISELDVDRTKSMKEAGRVAEKIRAALAEPYFLKVRQNGKTATTVEHHGSSSIGVVLFVNHSVSAEDILKRADESMYRAKNEGRNRIHYFDANAPYKSR